MHFTEYNCNHRDYFKLLDPIKEDLKKVDISKLITYGKKDAEGKKLYLLVSLSHRS